MIFNTGSTQFYNAAISGSNGIISPLSTSLSLSDNGDEDQITLSSAYQFDSTGNGSPGRRFYIATTPVSYICDTSSGTFTRYSDYAISASQPTNESVAPLSTAPNQTLVSDLITGCDFDYSPGSNTRTSLLVIDITLSLDGESVQILHQVQVSNVP